jgi:hypothetical protein
MVEKRIVKVEMFVEDVKKLLDFINGTSTSAEELSRIAKTLEAYIKSPDHNVKENWK